MFVEDNTVVDGDTPLLPFRRSQNGFWTTNEAMNWRLFGYDYPETRSANTTSAQATVAQLYSGSTRGRLATGQTGGVGHDSTPGTDATTYTDWVLNTAAAPLELPPTFVVQFSLVGDFSSDVSTNVGMWSVLMPMGHNKVKRSLRETEKRTQRASAAEMTMHGTISLTSSLMDQIEAGQLQSLDERDVVPFLKEKLTWKVYSVGRHSNILLNAKLTFHRVMARSFLTQAWMLSSSVLQANLRVFPAILMRQLRTAMSLLHTLR